MKVISIIVPSYNMEKYLPKCLGSLVVAPELMEQLEVLVVNDGSKDRTSEIAHEFAAKWPQTFKAIDKENGNYGSCINAALPIASGFYVKIVDADDYVMPDGFAKFLTILDRERRTDEVADVLVSDVETVTPGGKVISRSDYGMKPGLTLTLAEVREGIRFPIQGIAYRAELLREMNYVQSEGLSYTDTEWIIEPMARVKRLRYVPIAVSRYLVGRDGQTMEAKTFANKFWQVASITKGLVARYQERISVADLASVAYYKHQVLGMVGMCYYVGVFGYDGLKANFDLAAFDREILEISSLQDEIQNIRIPSRRFPIPLVAGWRRWHSRYALTFVAYRIYLVVIRLIGRVI